ncbi:MAG: 5-(carboxyamino)imidazole ribonucleotide synthase [Pseudomonadota bacterium]
MSARPFPVPPGGTLGVLGGGQLGRMIASSAMRLGLKTHVYADEGDNPGAEIASAATIAPFDDADALDRFAAAVDIATIEWENVPVDALKRIAAAGVPTYPNAETVRIAQDRVLEKTFINEAGVATAPWRKVDDLKDLRVAFAEIGGPAILKTRRFGYDGKGQARIAEARELDAAWAAIGEQPAILEGVAPFACEASVVLARTVDGVVYPFDIPRNDHEGGILSASTVPSGLDADVEEKLHAAARAVSEKFGDVGVLGVEFFVMENGDVLANEIAPRVHNSGHWSEDACDIGQFEQHARAVCGWPVRAPQRHSNARMRNILGADANDWLRDVAEPGARLTLYGKAEAREGRKMGHVTVLEPTST